MVKDDTEKTWVESELADEQKEEQEKVAQIKLAIAGPIGFIAIGMILFALWFSPTAIGIVGETYNHVADNGITGLIDVLHDVIFGLVFWVGMFCLIYGGAWGMSVVWMYR